VFVCDLVVIIKPCQGDQYNMYVEHIPTSLQILFGFLNLCLNVSMKTSRWKWIYNLNYGVQHLAFEVNGQHIWAMHHDLETMIPTFVNKNVYVIVQSLMNN
jgi:hypothetical protein